MHKIRHICAKIHEYGAQEYLFRQEYSLDMSTREQERQEYRSTFLDMSTGEQERHEYRSTFLDKSTGEQERHKYRSTV